MRCQGNELAEIATRREEADIPDAVEIVDKPVAEIYYPWGTATQPANMLGLRPLKGNVKCATPVKPLP